MENAEKTFTPLVEAPDKVKNGDIVMEEPGITPKSYVTPPTEATPTNGSGGGGDRSALKMGVYPKGEEPNPAVHFVNSSSVDAIQHDSHMTSQIHHLTAVTRALSVTADSKYTSDEPPPHSIASSTPLISAVVTPTSTVTPDQSSTGAVTPSSLDTDQPSSDGMELGTTTPRLHAPMEISSESDAGLSDVTSKSTPPPNVPSPRKRARGRRAISSASSLASTESDASGSGGGAVTGARKKTSRTRRKPSAAASKLSDDTSEDDDSGGGAKTTPKGTRRRACKGTGTPARSRSASASDSDDTREIKRRSTRVAINVSKLDKNAMMLMAEEEKRVEAARQKIRDEEKRLLKSIDDELFKVPTPPTPMLDGVDTGGKAIPGQPLAKPAVKKGFRRGRQPPPPPIPKVIVYPLRIPDGFLPPPSGPILPSNHAFNMKSSGAVVFPKTPQEGKGANAPHQNPEELETQAMVHETSKRADVVICYCGKERDFDKPDFQCCMCYCYVHGECTDIDINFDEVCAFMTNYQYFCKNCADREAFIKRQASFSQMCFTGLANLMQKNVDKEYFSKDKDIIPFLEKNWVKLTTSLRRQKTTWHTTVAKAMAKDDKVFGYGTATKGGDCLVRLLNQDLKRIAPDYDCLLYLSGGNVKTFLLGGDLNVEKPAPKPKVSRAMRRRNAENAAARRRGESTIPTKRSNFDYPIEYPFNKDGFRYLFAEQDPMTPHRKTFDESVEWAGRPIPGFLYRLRVVPHMVLALHDRAPQLKVGDDQLTATGDKGYCMARATHGVSYGSWYYEVKIKELPGRACTRIGWALTTANLQAPVGYDKFSYCWRARKGTVFHESIGKHYSPAYTVGDVIGFLIELGEQKPHRAIALAKAEYKAMPLVKFKHNFYYEERDLVKSKEPLLMKNYGSKMSMFINGKCQGVAFKNVYRGQYHPAISMYKMASIKMNFGPNFAFPPDTKEFKYKPMSKVVPDIISDMAMNDILYHIENKGKPMTDIKVY